MRKVETLLRTASALLLIVHNQLGNFNFFQQTSVISEEVEIHLQIPVSLLAALMLSIGGVHQKSHDTRDGPWHENPAPCQYLNRKSVVGNLKQQVFPLREKKKKGISTYQEVLSPQKTSTFCPQPLSHCKNLEGTHFFHDCIQH